MKTEDFVPKKAPDFTLQNADGVSVSLDDFAGKKVILFSTQKTLLQVALTKTAILTQVMLSL